MFDSYLSRRSYFAIAGVVIEVKSDLPITQQTFGPILRKFQIESPRSDLATIHHHFSLPDLAILKNIIKVYHQSPWAIYRNGDSWIYTGIMPEPDDHQLHRVAFFNAEHTQGHIYSPDERIFRKGNLESLTLFPTDQILLGRVLADRQGCILHAAGMATGGQGLLFVGHSEAGKSTIVTQLRTAGQILCDDRVIVRRWPDGFRIHGTWSHGDVAEVSPAAAPLRAILLLEQAPTNRMIPINDRQEIVRRLPFFVVRPLVTADWWEKTLDLVGQIAREVPVYRLQFDRSGRVREVLEEFLGGAGRV